MRDHRLLQCGIANVHGVHLLANCLANERGNLSPSERLGTGECVAAAVVHRGLCSEHGGGRCSDVTRINARERGVSQRREHLSCALDRAGIVKIILNEILYEIFSEERVTDGNTCMKSAGRRNTHGTPAFATSCSAIA